MAAKSWTFTLNNYTQEECDYLSSEELRDLCNVIFIGKEVGEQGTPHLQGYITLKKAARLTGVKKINERAHWEKAKGNKDQNRTYCLKDGDILVTYDIGGSGKRNDLDLWVEDYKEHGFKRACLQHHRVAIRYPRGLMAYKTLSEEYEPRSEHPEVIWAYGPTGIGKTHIATTYPSYYCLMKWPWCDGLTNQHCFVLDEFDKLQIPVQVLLRLTDRYQMRVEIKGGSLEFNPPVILITSTGHPEQLFDPTDWTQVRRRITRLITKEKKEDDWTEV